MFLRDLSVDSVSGADCERLGPNGGIAETEFEAKTPDIAREFTHLLISPRAPNVSSSHGSDTVLAHNPKITLWREVPELSEAISLRTLQRSRRKRYVSGQTGRLSLKLSTIGQGVRRARQKLLLHQLHQNPKS